MPRAPSAHLPGKGALAAAGAVIERHFGRLHQVNHGDVLELLGLNRGQQGRHYRAVRARVGELSLGAGQPEEAGGRGEFRR